MVTQGSGIGLILVCKRFHYFLSNPSLSIGDEHQMLGTNPVWKTPTPGLKARTFDAHDLAREQAPHHR
ncbi:hypothetical protein [Verminephrobacter eiseniae]|uniref:hypothetical protein n=1 Tax=Verminephrobacter eiseniae TaxID=364317 RepID=UPI0022382529|nr:hypothetical protein [Verminephrobacter eiseniae]